MFKSKTKYSQNRQKGNIAENIAALFLMKQGFQIIDRNYLKPWGEIDIVAQKAKRLYFIEVKSVSCEINNKNVSRETLDRLVTHETIRPEENMTEQKLKRIERVIKTYISNKNISRETIFQLDLITVRFDAKKKIAIVKKFDNVMV